MLVVHRALMAQKLCCRAVVGEDEDEMVAVFSSVATYALESFGDGDDRKQPRVISVDSGE